MSWQAYPKTYGSGVDEELREEVRKLSEKVDCAIAKLDGDERVSKYSGVEYGENPFFDIFYFSGLIWWNEIENAARYRLVLSINDEEVGTIYLDKETRYYSVARFPRCVSYKLMVTVEDRDGEELAWSVLNLEEIHL